MQSTVSFATNLLKGLIEDSKKKEVFPIRYGAKKKLFEALKKLYFEYKAENKTPTIFDFYRTIGDLIEENINQIFLSSSEKEISTFKTEVSYFEDFLPIFSSLADIELSADVDFLTNNVKNTTAEKLLGFLPLNTRKEDVEVYIDYIKRKEEEQEELYF